MMINLKTFFKISIPVILAICLSVFIYQESIDQAPYNYYPSTNDTFYSHLKLMTYNIRSSNLDYGRNHWSNRKYLLTSKIQEYSPDIIGTQEGLPGQLKDLEVLLPEYKTVGHLNLSNKEFQENLLIFYNFEKFELIEADYFWLSDNPKMELSNTWGGKFARVATFAIFKIISSNLEFLVINTHYDHISKYARLKSSELINEFIRNLNKQYITFILGDFNEVNHSTAYNVFINDGFKDSFDNCYNGRLETTCNPGKIPKSTFHNFFGKIVNYPLINGLTYLGYAYVLDNFPSWVRFHLDWILYRDNEDRVESVYTQVCEDDENYIRIMFELFKDFRNGKELLKKYMTYPSDHYPVYTLFKIYKK